MSRESTRNRIVDTALRLFNQQGSEAVSTNHIAAAAGISPGNLYYHFRNKEEIVRAIFERMIALMDAAWTPPGGQAADLSHLRAAFERVFRLLSDYRFFQREINTLCRRDPDLKRRNQEIRRQRFGEFDAFFEGLRRAGVLTGPDDPAARRNLVTVGWIVTDYWLSFLDLEDRPVDAEAIGQGVNLIIEGLRPYMLPDAFAELARPSREPLDRSER